MAIVDTTTGHRHRIDDPAAGSNFMVFSDSTLFDAMPGVQAGGDSQESRSPHNTLLAMQTYLSKHEGALNGKTVVLSSLTNNTGDAASLEATIELAKKNGATKVVVVGMGNDNAAQNPAIKALAEKHGAVYAELGPNNGVHSTNTSALVKNITDAAGVETPVAPVIDDHHGDPGAVVTEPRSIHSGPVRGTRRDRHAGGPGRHGRPHPGGPESLHPHGIDHTLTEALHGRATKAGARHMLKLEHSLGVHVTDGAFGARTIRELQHKLHDRQTGVLNQHDVKKIEEIMRHRHRHPQPGAP